jgi:hypothetical protein
MKFVALGEDLGQGEATTSPCFAQAREAAGRQFMAAKKRRSPNMANPQPKTDQSGTRP